MTRIFVFVSPAAWQKPFSDLLFPVVLLSIFLFAFGKKKNPIREIGVIRW